MDYLVGGAFIGVKRIADYMTQYEWGFSTEVERADIVIYMNNNRHYNRAKELKIPHIIQRKTGERSLKIATPADLDAVICASKRSFDCTNHAKKVLIYNGIDLDYLKTIKPKENIELLSVESRIGQGQRVDLSCEYAIKHKKHLTILGSKANLHEDTYYVLKVKYPQFNWVGSVSPDEALTYVKGCEAIVISNPSHGVANQVIEAILCDKPVIALANIEIPPRDQVDIKITAEKYDALIKSIVG